MTRTTTHYLRRVVPLRPETGKATFDAVAAYRVVLVRGRRRSRVAVSSGRLEFEPPIQAGGPIGPWVYRRTRGVLRWRWNPMPLQVELELAPWSASQVELGLRLAPRRHISKRFMDLAQEALHEVALDMEAQLGTWLAYLDRSVGAIETSTTGPVTWTDITFWLSRHEE